MSRNRLVLDSDDTVLLRYSMDMACSAARMGFMVPFHLRTKGKQVYSCMCLFSGHLVLRRRGPSSIIGQTKLKCYCSDCFVQAIQSGIGYILFILFSGVIYRNFIVIYGVPQHIASIPGISNYLQ